jgi:RNA polymerase sigma factor (sigma-70 family)
MIEVRNEERDHRLVERDDEGEKRCRDDARKYLRQGDPGEGLQRSGAARQRRALGQPLDGPAADQLPSAELDPQQRLERWELVNAVHAAIAALPRAQREVLVLRDLEGMSGEEAAIALGLDLTAMKTRLHRGRAALRASLPRFVGEGSL